MMGAVKEVEKEKESKRNKQKGKLALNHDLSRKKKKIRYEP